MSEIKNGGLDQYGAEHFEQQQFGTAGVEGVKRKVGLSISEIDAIMLPSNMVKTVQLLGHWLLHFLCLNLTNAAFWLLLMMSNLDLPKSSIDDQN